MRNSKAKSIQLIKRKMTEEEKLYLEKILEKEKVKYKQDSKCGGVIDSYYIRLHTR